MPVQQFDSNPQSASSDLLSIDEADQQNRLSSASSLTTMKDVRRSNSLTTSVQLLQGSSEEVEHLSGKQILSLCFDFLTTENGEKLRADHFVFLWRMDAESAATLLDYLAELSLLEKRSDPNDNGNDVYWLNSLQRACLLEFARSSGHSTDDGPLRWIKAFVLKYDKTSLLNSLSEGDTCEYNSTLARVIRVIGFGGRWDECFPAFEDVLRQVRLLPEFQRSLLSLLVNFADEDHGWTVLHESSKRGQQESVKVLLYLGAKVDAATTKAIRFGDCSSSKSKKSYARKTTPMHVAATGGFVEIIWDLWAKRASVNSLNETGWNALHCAVYEGHINAARELIARGANVTAVDKLDRTLFDLASMRDDNTMQEFLIEHGAHPRESNRRSPQSSSSAEDTSRMSDDDENYTEQPATAEDPV